MVDSVEFQWLRTHVAARLFNVAMLHRLNFITVGYFLAAGATR